MAPQIRDLKVYVPAKDFELSKRFYLAMGFTMSEGFHNLRVRFPPPPPTHVLVEREPRVGTEQCFALAAASTNPCPCGTQSASLRRRLHQPPGGTKCKALSPGSAPLRVAEHANNPEIVYRERNREQVGSSRSVGSEPRVPR
jgi:hypothetical protein